MLKINQKDNESTKKIMRKNERELKKLFVLMNALRKAFGNEPNR